MDFANVGAALSTLTGYDASSSVATGSLAYAIGTEMLSKSLDLNEALGASMVRMMERSVTPAVGGNVDVYV